MKKILLPLLSRVVSVFERIRRSVRNYRYARDPGILVGPFARIHSRASLELIDGGTISIANGTWIGHGVYLATYGGKIAIGENCSINAYTVIYGHGNTTIGNNVLIAGHCMIIPNSHIFRDPDIPVREQGCTSAGIVIEDDVWIGHGVSVLDGVTIGKGSIIAAGTVVKDSVPQGTILGGIPGKEIGKR